MKLSTKINMSLLTLILSIFLLTSCSKSENDKTQDTKTEEVKTTKKPVAEVDNNDTRCAQCGKMFVGADGYCGKIENVSGSARSWGYAKGSYCSEACGADSNF
jgi:hypothetical protein